MPSVEVSLSPALFPFSESRSHLAVIVIDVFRASTSIIAAFDHGVREIIPLETLEEAEDMKQKGFLLAGERDGKKLDFADFGNSPLEFTTARLMGKSMAFTSTNGTRAIKVASKKSSLYIGAFTNMYALSTWLCRQNTDVQILCAGWKNRFSLEDTICAGAFVQLLAEQGNYLVNCDAARAAFKLWENAKGDLLNSLYNSEHAKRLIALGQENDLDYCLSSGVSSSIPVYRNGVLIELSNLEKYENHNTDF